jgi:flagellar hook protein FlgE
MSLLGSISTAITGLTAQSACLGNISDNLANTTTTGFKSIGTSFRDIVSTESCGPTGLGARATPAYYNNLQGSIAVNATDTFMAISGRGFFTVTPGNDDGATANPGGTYYTRNGDFALDKDGYMANGAGYYLMGWSVNRDTGEAQTGALVPLQFTELIDSGVPTTALEYEANLPSEVDVTTTTEDSLSTIYDSEGKAHNVAFSWEKTGMNVWDLTITVTGGAYDAATDTENDYTATATFDFEAGHIHEITSADCQVTGTSLSFPVVFKEALPQTVTSNFNELTQFADTTLDLVAFSQNGAPAGSFHNVSVDSNGLASINYDNGISRVYYQISLANFHAAESLQRVTGTLFQETLSSGSASYSAAGTEGAGKLAVGALENSTVDIADQFTRMIQAQRAYAANAKTVSVSDSMLQTLVTI